MKFLKFSAAILSLSILTACKSGQSVQTSETVSESETSAVTTSETTATTTETETETEKETVPAEDDIAFDNELVSALADIIERHNVYNFFMYDFNRDGCPEIALYIYDGITPMYCNIYDFSNGEEVSMGGTVPGECSETPDIDCCCELYFDENSDEYIYVSLWRRSYTEESYYIQQMYLTKASSDMKFSFDEDENEYFYEGSSKEKWDAMHDKALKSLSEYTLIEHINVHSIKTYTTYEYLPNQYLYTSVFNSSPHELALIALNDYYMEN